MKNTTIKKYQNEMLKYRAKKYLNFSLPSGQVVFKSACRRPSLCCFNTLDGRSLADPVPTRQEISNEKLLVQSEGKSTCPGRPDCTE